LAENNRVRRSRQQEKRVDNPLIYVRALHFAATLTVAGVALFVAFIAEPAFGKADAGALTGVVRRRLAWLASFALLLTVLSGIAWLILVTQAVSDLFSEDILWTVLSETDFGRVWLGRFALACPLAALFVPFLRAGTSRPVWLKLVVVLLAASLAGTLAWAGHAVGGVGVDGIVHPAADVLHLVAAAWVGALLPLALTLGAAGSLAAAQTMTVRFSTLGVVAVGTLLVTGSINTWYLAGSIPALTETDYGRLLLLKIAFFLAMVAIAAVNRLRLTPHLVGGTTERATRDALRRLRRNVAVEIAAGAAVLAIVAILGVTPPGVDEQMMPHAEHHSH
jgi:putative copper resistance protein D